MRITQLIFALLFLSACRSMTPADPTVTPKPEVPVTDRITHLAPGFSVDIYAETGLNLVTVLTFGPDDALYVLSFDGGIQRLHDTDGDGRADTREMLYSDPDQILSHAAGMAFHPDDDRMYISHAGKISQFTDSDGNGVLDTHTELVTGLPTQQYPWHSNNGIAFGPDGKLYIAVGSTTDHGPLQAEWEASILRMNDDGSDLEVFATGFRNPYDLTFAPNGDLFTADNSPDALDATLRYLPPEELNHVREGRHYGFPEVFGKMLPDGDSSEPPITEFYTSVASSGLVYYAADHFPADYQQGVFVAQYGTGAHPVLDRGQRNGFSVVFVPLQPTADGTYSGDFETFLQFEPPTAGAPTYHPVDVTVGPDGALYVAELTRGEIYRVTYTPDTAP